jgi:hypothetical protein
MLLLFRNILRIVSLGCVISFMNTTALFAQSYEETLNFIFNGNKAWSGVEFGANMANQLSDYDQEKCTVQIRSTPYRRLGTIYLGALTRWRWEVKSDGTNEFGMLHLEAEGDIFHGDYFSQGNMRNGCGKNCSFLAPVDLDSSRLASAFQHLWNNYCKQGTPSSAF